MTEPGAGSPPGDAESFGKFRLLEKLAEGGMAEVFLAKADGPGSFEKTLVLKRILPAMAEDPEFVELFLAEARVAALHTHPNIVQVFDFGEVNGTYYLAMEHVDGVDLRTLSRRAGALRTPLPYPLCAKLVAYACEGLAHAHELADPTTGRPLNLVHRDATPENIMVGRNGAVKVVDFGIAKVAGARRVTRAGFVRGKVAYMPPEQIAGKALDPRADVYTLGVVLYELVKGRKPPAEGEAEPARPLGEKPPVPEKLERILEQALAKSRQSRFSSCRELHRALEDYLRGAPGPIGSFEIGRLVDELAPPRTRETQLQETRTSPQSEDAVETVCATAPSRQERNAPSPRPAAARGPNPRRAQLAKGLASVAIGFGFTWLLTGAVGPWSAGGRSTTAGESAAVLPTAAEEASLPAALPPAPAQEEAAPATLEQPAPIAERNPPRAKVKGSPTKIAPELPHPQESAPLAQGVLEFRVYPYATVMLDGKVLGQTPLDPVQVVAGRHTVRLINVELGKDLTFTVETRGGERTVLKRALKD